ncbi:MAG: Spy/CpxP family protein refolding chaperone [Candidatus Rokuibacteriota bacterium]
MARRYLKIAVAVLSLLAAAGAAPASERASGAPVVPTVHEEMSRSLTDLMDRFESLGAQVRDHFTPRDFPRERPLISIMLSHRAEIGLSSEQVEALEELRADFRKEAIRAEADLKIAETDLGGQLAADPVDLPQVEAKVREIERRRADLRVARIRTIEQGRARLTADQREKLRALLAHGRLPEMRAIPAGPPPPRAPHRL